MLVIMSILASQKKLHVTMILRNYITQPLACLMNPSIYGHYTLFILELHYVLNKLSLDINVK